MIPLECMVFLIIFCDTMYYGSYICGARARVLEKRSPTRIFGWPFIVCRPPRAAPTSTSCYIHDVKVKTSQRVALANAITFPQPIQ